MLTSLNGKPIFITSPSVDILLRNIDQIDRLVSDISWMSQHSAAGFTIVARHSLAHASRGAKSGTIEVWLEGKDASTDFEAMEAKDAAEADAQAQKGSPRPYRPPPPPDPHHRISVYKSTDARTYFEDGVAWGTEWIPAVRAEDVAGFLELLVSTFEQPPAKKDQARWYRGAGDARKAWPDSKNRDAQTNFVRALFGDATRQLRALDEGKPRNPLQFLSKPHNPLRFFGSYFLEQSEEEILLPLLWPALAGTTNEMVLNNIKRTQFVIGYTPGPSTTSGPKGSSPPSRLAAVARYRSR